MSTSNKKRGDAAEAKAKDVVGRLAKLRKAIKRRRWTTALVSLAGLIGVVAGAIQGINYYSKLVFNRDLAEALKGISVILIPGKPTELPDYRQKALIALVTKNRDKIEDGKQVDTEYLLQLGNVEYSLGNTSQARHYYDKALKQAREKENQVNEAAALVNLATIELAREEREGLATALTNTSDALKIHEAKQMAEEQANDFAIIGQIHRKKKEFRKAILAYQQARQFYLQRGKFGRAADMELALGQVYYETGAMAEALDCLKQADKRHSEAGDQKGRADDLLQTGEIYWKQGKLNLALRDLKAARKIFSDQRLEGEEAKALSQMGTIYLLMGDRDHALKDLRKSIGILKRSMAERKKQAWILYRIGLVYTDQGSTEAGVAYMLKAVRTAREIKDQELEAHAQHHIALSHKKRGQFDQAL